MHVWLNWMFGFEHARTQMHICVHIFLSDSDLSVSFHNVTLFPVKKLTPIHRHTSAQAHTNTHFFIAVHITKSHSLILLPCKFEALVSTNAILFVLYSDSHSAHFGNIEKESGWRVTGGEGCWQNRPQMPQMGFQSVLIYLSPWGLRSVVICLCLGWHDRCPSCFRLCSHRSFHAYRIIHSSVNSLRLFLFLGQDLEDEKKKDRDSCSGIDPEEPSSVVVHFPSSTCSVCVYCFEEVKVGDKPSTW